MVITLDLVLLIAGAICFFLAAIGFAVSRVNLIALGLLFWILTQIISG
jgi:hypothetical protein